MLHSMNAVSNQNLAWPLQSCRFFSFCPCSKWGHIHIYTKQRHPISAERREISYKRLLRVRMFVSLSKLEICRVFPAFHPFSSTGQVLRYPDAIRRWHDQVPELGPVHTDAASRQHMRGKIVHSCNTNRTRGSIRVLCNIVKFRHVL
jgi:hypothetical protein